MRLDFLGDPGDPPLADMDALGKAADGLKPIKLPRPKQNAMLA